MVNSLFLFRLLLLLLSSKIGLISPFTPALPTSQSQFRSQSQSQLLSTRLYTLPPPDLDRDRLLNDEPYLLSTVRLYLTSYPPSSPSSPTSPPSPSLKTYGGSRSNPFLESFSFSPRTIVVDQSSVGPLDLGELSRRGWEVLVRPVMEYPGGRRGVCLALGIAPPPLSSPGEERPEIPGGGIKWRDEAVEGVKGYGGLKVGKVLDDEMVDGGFATYVKEKEKEMEMEKEMEKENEIENEIENENENEKEKEKEKEKLTQNEKLTPNTNLLGKDWLPPSTSQKKTSSPLWTAATIDAEGVKLGKSADWARGVREGDGKGGGQRRRGLGVSGRGKAWFGAMCLVFSLGFGESTGTLLASVQGGGGGGEGVQNVLELAVQVLRVLGSGMLVSSVVSGGYLGLKGTGATGTGATGTPPPSEAPPSGEEQNQRQNSDILAAVMRGFLAGPTAVFEEGEGGGK